KHEIEDDEVRVTSAGARDTFRAGERDGHVVPFALQRCGHGEGKVGVVFDHEHARHRQFTPGAVIGRATTNRAPRAPLPFTGTTCTRPRCSSTSRRTTTSPMPVPPTAPPASRFIR